MSGVIQYRIIDGELPRSPFALFEAPSEPPGAGCFDRLIGQEWFRNQIVWPVAQDLPERLLAWLDETGIRHEWHAIQQVHDDGPPAGIFVGVHYVIRFFNKTDASAYRLIFE